MGIRILAEVFGDILFRFTRSVTEHYNPEEADFTVEAFGYDPLESTGREWYYQPVDELIYHEYGDREATTWDYLPSNSLNIQVVNACSPDEETDGHQEDDRAMAWKRLRPPALNTVGKSMYIGALISLLAATFLGTQFTLICSGPLYLKTLYRTGCSLRANMTNSSQTPWIITGSWLIATAFLYIWPFTVLLFLFRPYQLVGVKRKLLLVCFVFFCLNGFYRGAIEALSRSHYKVPSVSTWFPLYVFFISSLCFQHFLLTRHCCSNSSKKQKVAFFFQIAVPSCLFFITGQMLYRFIYPVYIAQDKEGKFLTALFAPLFGVLVKIISRICVQRLYNITHPGYSYALLVPLYYGSAVLFRGLQAELQGLQYIAVIGVIHGAAEVIERSTMVFIDHICHVLWKRKSAPWGSFRTPRRERLMADTAIMSMLSESTAIVSVNGFIYLHKFLCLKDNSLFEVLQLFAKCTSVQLVIEWFFTSVSLAIETRYQNLAVMAVWRRRWKRHFLLAGVNVVPLAVYISGNLQGLAGRSEET